MIDPTTLQKLIAWIVRRTGELVFEWKLNPETAVRWAIVELLAPLAGEQVGTIISGYRSPQRQRELKANWDAQQLARPLPYPERGEVAHAPARRSFHMIGQAIDVTNPSPGPVARAIWRSMGGAVGLDFGDANHLHTTKPLPASPAAW